MHSIEDISDARREVMEAIASSLDEAGAEIVGLGLIREMMARTEARELAESELLTVAESADADFVIIGSLTRLGRTYNVDWRVLDTATAAPLGFYYESAGSVEELIGEIERTVGSMYSMLSEAPEARQVVREGNIYRVTVQGNKRIDSEAIAAKIKSKAGEPFSTDTVREDIRSIYGMGFIEDIRVDLSARADGTELTFIVKEKPRIKSITIKGNDEITTDVLKKILDAKFDSTLNPSVLIDDTERIKILYEAKGYYLVEVEHEAVSDELGADVTFTIDEGEKVRIKRITITGNEAFTDDELKDMMRTKEQSLYAAITGAALFKEPVFENDLAIIVRHYMNSGYVRADVVEHSVLLSEDRLWFYITIAVSEGEKYTVSGIDLTGELLRAKEELLENFGFTEGETFNRAKLTAGIDALKVIYGDEGYANAEFDIHSRIDDSSRTVYISLEITKNELVYIERIDIKGNTRTRDKVIRREFELVEGELFSSTALKNTKSNLKRLGYFQDVWVSRSPGTTSDRMKIDVEVEEVYTGSFTLGVGYSTVDKIIGTASILQTNFLGTGIVLNLSVALSGSGNNYNLSFTEPWLFEKPISAGFDIYNTEKEYQDFTIEKDGFDIKLGFPIYKRTVRGSVIYTLEDAFISDVSDDASIIITSQEGMSTVSSLQTILKADTRDDAFFPTEGSVVKLSTEYAGGPLGGTTDFVKYEASAIRYFQMPLSTVLSIKGSVGLIEGFGGSDVPIYEKYFLGGINSIRGFETRSVGPEDPETEELIGGESMLVVNTELVFPIMSSRTIRGVVFFDVGNSYESKIVIDDLRYGAGVGMRWFSPVGPLRIEWGYNLDKRDGEDQSMWEFTVGSPF